MDSSTHFGSPAVRRKRRKTPADRRQDLLDVAVACLAELGPRGATGREICRRAGVSHGLLRHYFANPDDLLLEAYKDLCDRYLAEFDRRLLDDAVDPWAALDAFFEVLFSDQWSSPEVLGAWIAFWTLTRSDEAFARVNAAYNARLGALLERSLGRLPVKPAQGLSLETAGKILAASMDGLWLEFCLRPGGGKRGEAIDLCRLTLRRLVEA